LSLTKDESTLRRSAKISEDCFIEAGRGINDFKLERLKSAAYYFGI
jgi:hypothetical protein